MTLSGPVLIHNGIYLGVAFIVALTVTLIATSAFLRFSDLFLRARILALSSESRDAFRRRVWRLAILFLTLATLSLAGGAIYATWRQVYLGDLLRSGLSRMGTQDWLYLGLAVAKALGVLLLAFLIARLFIALLHHLRERLQRAESLAGHREQLTEILLRLRLVISCSLLFGTLILCSQLLGLPEVALRILRAVAYLGIAFYIARFAVGTAHLTIEVLFGLSDMLARLESPLRYLGRLRHLSKLTKTCADYFIYVGVATWTLEQITPGTWAIQAGRVAIRIIAIFYISRVVVEVCLLGLNEFFLTRDQHTDAEYQQRQTLVPVAAGLLRYGIYFSAIIMILREAGLDPMPLLAGAGVVGVAIGLGAQAFVGDLVAGFFILFENLVLVGDFVEVSEVKGKIEEIGIRVTRIRDESGILHAIPNGEMRKIANHSRDYVNVIIDIPVPYGENVHRIFEVLSQKTAALRADQPAILGLTEFSLEDLRESALLLRTVTMVKPGTDQETSSELRLAFWEALTAAGIAAPHTRQQLLAPKQDDAPQSAPHSARISDENARSDIQRLKAHNLYRAFDIDDNGYIEKRDADALAHRIIENQRRQPGSSLHQELQRRLAAYWSEMVRYLDIDHDGRVSREEFLQFTSGLTRDLSGAGGKAVESLADVLFAIADHDGAGTITESEFLGWSRAYGILDHAAAAGFRLLDEAGTGRISRDTWHRFTRLIFQSKRTNDAAALVFGPGSRKEAT